MKRPEQLQPFPQQTYILALAQKEQTGPLRPRVPVATATTPTQVCGGAHRVGYTSTHSNAFAIYRIKASVSKRGGQVTLPSLYVLVNGLFVDYHHWVSSEQQ